MFATKNYWVIRMSNEANELTVDPLEGIPRVRVIDENGEHVLTGYYIYHEKIRTCFAGELTSNEVRHLVAYESFADWGMPVELRICEVTPPHYIEVIE